MNFSVMPKKSRFLTVVVLCRFGMAEVGCLEKTVQKENGKR